MEKYVLSIYVKNHSGVLQRVSGLFSRRGYNIESLSVSVTERSDISCITIVVIGDLQILDQIEKQVLKLVEVISVERLEGDVAVYRELALIKIKTTDENRTEIIELLNIFRARIVAVAPSSLIAEVTGDSSKVQSFINTFERFTILELVRTGLTAIKRGNQKRENNKNLNI